ncbi:hypothetical protein P4N68_09445 [Corynebacterium felinum]|uniref:Cbb3-type cytochrome oxidase subunit 3 n=1 Tax=Corynebacterium felinum TaxID=131318 RepID=A0ABU2B879_9CORY|nr:hypothetical protein [Corynebacterium felinum]MDF5821299.1 hypothetical protein [Corynebacterium felinum]MDR7354819.1 cbb3-type cytochrome oxidase subunit 3 [Corynebacterium felinum]WJY94179.1 hypothetical protein CFELI_02685 [Corynebacterium felinum]
MSAYFKAVIVYMFVFSICAIMFDGLDTVGGTTATIVLSMLSALVTWFVSSREGD